MTTTSDQNLRHSKTMHSRYPALVLPFLLGLLVIPAWASEAARTTGETTAQNTTPAGDSNNAISENNLHPDAVAGTPVKTTGEKPMDTSSGNSSGDNTTEVPVATPTKKTGNEVAVQKIPVTAATPPPPPGPYRTRVRGPESMGAIPPPAAMQRQMPPPMTADQMAMGQMPPWMGNPMSPQAQARSPASGDNSEAQAENNAPPAETNQARVARPGQEAWGRSSMPPNMSPGQGYENGRMPPARGPGPGYRGQPPQPPRYYPNMGGLAGPHQGFPGGPRAYRAPAPNQGPPPHHQNNWYGPSRPMPPAFYPPLDYRGGYPPPPPWGQSMGDAAGSVNPGRYR